MNRLLRQKSKCFAVNLTSMLQLEAYMYDCTMYIMQRKSFDFFETKDSRNEDNCFFQRSEDGRPQLGEAQPAVHRRGRNKNRINLDINDSWLGLLTNHYKGEKDVFFRRVLDAEGPFRDVRQRVYPGLFNDTDRWHWTGNSSEQETHGTKV